MESINLLNYTQQICLQKLNVLASLGTFNSHPQVFSEVLFSHALEFRPHFISAELPSSRSCQTVI